MKKVRLVHRIAWLALLLSIGGWWGWGVPKMSVVEAQPPDWKPGAIRPFVLTGNEHPRLFFSGADVARLRSEAGSTHADIYQPIKEFSDSQIDHPAVKAPQSGADLDTFRNAGNELIAMAFTCVISNDNNYCDLVKSDLLTYAGWQQWGDKDLRDIGQAHMMLGNAIAYDWLYDRLSQQERASVRNSLGQWAQKMYEASASSQFHADWGNWWSEAYSQNHNWVDNSALGVVGLALLGEDDRAQSWTDQAKNDMTRVQFLLNGIRDGSWHEGIQYQNYGLTLSLPFLVNLRRIQGVDLIPHDYYRGYVNWRLYNTLPGSTQYIMAYGDFDWFWGNSYMAQNILRFIAGEFNDPAAEWAAQQLIKADGRAATIYAAPWYVFEFLFYRPDIPPGFPNHPPKSWLFPDLQGVIWRTGWEASDLVFGLKSGAFGGNFIFDTFTQGVYPWEPPCPETGCQLNSGHDHQDVGTFYLYKNGQWLAPESAGYGKTDTNFHNSILIDQRSQYRPADSNNGKYVADFVNSNGSLQLTASTPNFDYLSADATQSYKNITGIQQINRQVIFVRPGYLVMLDNLAASSPHQYQWVSHFGQSVSVEGNWVKGDAGGGQILGVGIMAPTPFTTSSGNDGTPFIHIQPASPVNSMKFINVLYPTDTQGWNSRPKLNLFASTDQASGLEVHRTDGSNLIDQVMATYNQGGTTVQIGPYATDGQAAVVTRDTNNNLVRVFLYGGTSLTEPASGAAFVQGLARGGSYEASYSGNTVEVNGNVAAQMSLYAPNADTVKVNGASWDFLRRGDVITLLGPMRCFPQACG